MENKCVIFVVEKLFIVNLFGFHWTWILKLINLLGYGWTWTKF